MTTDLPPLLLRPHYVIKPWGGRRLADDLGRDDLPEGPVGESWELHDVGDGTSSVVDGGPFDGRLLRELLGGPVPLLVKVLDAREDLSVQLHPGEEDEAQAKEEAWVALSDGAVVAVESAGAVHADAAAPPPGGWLGCLPRRVLSSGCRHEPRPPDMVHVPPGTVHAILAGSLLLEVQNPVNVTWRLDDHGRTDAHGRARELHHAQAFAALARPTPAPVEPRADGCRLQGGHFGIQLLPPGTHAGVAAGVVFFTQAGTITYGVGQALDVPRGRTAWLDCPAERVQSTGWIVTAAAR